MSARKDNSSRLCSSTGYVVIASSALAGKPRRRLFGNAIVFQTVLEGTNAFGDIAHGRRQFAGSEQQHHDRQDDNPVHEAKASHRDVSDQLKSGFKDADCAIRGRQARGYGTMALDDAGGPLDRNDRQRGRQGVGGGRIRRQHSDREPI